MMTILQALLGYVITFTNLKIDQKLTVKWLKNFPSFDTSEYYSDESLL